MPDQGKMTEAEKAIERGETVPAGAVSKDTQGRWLDQNGQPLTQSGGSQSGGTQGGQGGQS
jgi:hypothetical protein